MNTETLYKAGLTKGETKVYLALLQTGTSSIGKIVEQSKVTKSKVYDILFRLKDKGLVSNSLKNNINHFSAAPPNFLLDLLDKREQKIQEERKELQSIIPQLLTLQEESSQKERVEIFEGYRGMKSAFQIAENEFEKEKEFLVLGVGVQLSAKQLQFFQAYHQRRVQAKVKTKVLFPEEYRRKKGYHMKQGTYNKEKYIRKEGGAIPFNIYKDIIIIPILEEGKKETTILLRNKKLAKGLKEYFKLLWNIAKE